MHKMLKGDALEKAREFEDNTFDALLSDCPYGISFMHKKWDYGLPSKIVWQEMYRILKPGAFILVFGGTRTFHRLACHIEDAGFEIRDCLMYVYGGGFPKGHNLSVNIDKHLGKERVKGELRTDGRGKWDLKVSREKGDTGVGHADGSKQQYYETLPASDDAKRWEGYNIALKPAYEPIILARKPVEGNNVKNCLKYGCGGLNIDKCRIKTDDKLSRPFGNGGIGAQQLNAIPKGTITGDHNKGRWPANLILDGSEQVEEMFPDSKGQQGDVKGTEKSRTGGKGTSCYGEYQRVPAAKRNDSGSASRFFQKCPADRIYYTSKVSKKERNAGLDAHEDQEFSRSVGAQNNNEYGKEHIGFNKKVITKNPHPCLKPISLCEYLAKLILPPERETPRKIIVPFAGTGSEMAGALNVGWDEVIGIEYEEEYCNLAEKRIPALIST